MLSVATEIQQYLFDLLDKEQAEFVNQQLQILLSKAKDGKDVDVDILDLLTEHEPTRQWMEERKRSTSDVNKGYPPSVGDHNPPPSIRYQCANGHTKHLPKMPTTAPTCQECGSPMTKQSGE